MQTANATPTTRERFAARHGGRPAWHCFRHEVGRVTAWARGDAIESGALQRGDALARRAADAMLDASRGDLLTAAATWAAGLNGSWAAAVAVGESLVLAVDRTRTIPLFYHATDGRAADDPAELCADGALDDITSIEFLFTGFVTGSDTLTPDVRQVRAGEVVELRLDHADRGLDRRAKRYRRFLPTADAADDAAALSAGLMEALEHAFARCIQRLDGRRAVIPLSGGLDSRVVAAMLKRGGVEDALCFTYGDPDHDEVARSRDVAAALGYRWVHVPYSARDWRRWMNLPHMTAYWDFAGRFASLPLVQDWAALYELREHFGDEPLVFIPGHTLDMLAGGHLRSRPDRAPASGRDARQAAEMILSREAGHFHLWPLQWLAKDDRAALRERVIREIDVLDEYPLATNADLGQLWNHDHRQARFIVNSVRAYEFFGHEWMVPGWDHELTDFFLAVPPMRRYRKQLYIDTCLNKLFTGPLRRLAEIDLGLSLPHFRPPAALTRLKHLAYCLPVVGELREVSRLRHAVQNDPYRMATWFIDGDYFRRVRDTPLSGAGLAGLPAVVRRVLERAGSQLCMRCNYNGLLAAHVLARWAGE